MDYGIIIVGGRVAGAILATRLGQLGTRVLLLEKATFPSDTLSTSFFRAPALRVFEKIGVLDEVMSAAPPLRTLWNYIDGHVLSDPVEAARPHVGLDPLPAPETRPNVDARLGANVRDLIWQDERLIGVRWVEHGEVYEACAQAVVGADGFYSTLAKTLNPVYEDFVPVQRCTYYTYFQGLDSFDEPTAEHHFVGNTLTYVFPTDGNLTMVALSLPISEFPSFKKDPLRKLQTHLESLPLLAPRLAKAEIATEIYGAGNIPCYQRLPYGPGWALVGDAQQVLDPWSGMGIDHAATHADFLAEALDHWLKEEATWETAMNDYHTRARAWSKKQYRRTSIFAADFRPMTRAALQKRGLVRP